MSDELLLGPQLDLSCPDWEDRLRTGRSLVPVFPWLWEAEGNRAVQALDKLRLADVPQTPLFGEAGGDWFRDIVRAMFGALDPTTGERRIRELFLLVPKKNSKTTNGALFMLVALLVNARPRAKFILTAPVQDTADQAFSAIAGAIQLDPVLEQVLHVREHLKTIVHRTTKATLEVMTFDPKVLTGQKVSGGVLVDELHVVAKMAKAPSAIRQLRGGMLPFPGAFMAFITTQSEDQPTGVFKQELEKARAIRDSKRMGAMLPVLYEFPVAMQRDREQWTNPANWHMVTPNLGRSIALPRLVEEYTTARDTNDAELRGWASQHLNVEIGLALAAGGWAGGEFWLQAAGKAGKPDGPSNVDPKLADLKAMLARCEVAVIGIDGGGLDDLLGFAVLGRERGTRKWLLWTHAWAHRVVLTRRKEIAQALQQFAADGNLTLVDQPGDDVRAVAELCVVVRDTGLLPPKAAVGVDAAGIGDIIDALTAPAVGFTLEGPEGGQIVAVSQGWRLNAAIKTTERALAAGDLHHAGTALMSWVVANAVPEPRGNAVLITKQAAGTAKIDPLMAAFDAVSLMAMAPVAQVIGEEDAEVLAA